MPQQTVLVQVQGRTKILTREEKTGGVFAPVPGKRMLPAYSFGLEGPDRTVMFTCPQSAIPVEVWQLLNLWNTCRLMKTLPVAGGLLDQPVWVQRYFPIFESELRRAEARNGNTAEQAAMLAVGTMVKAISGGVDGGGKKR